MRLFGFDISKSNTGWGTLTSKRIECGSFVPAGEFDPQVFLSFERFFVGCIERYIDTPEPVTHVAIERVMPGGKAKLEVIPGKEDMVGGVRIKDFTNFESQAYLLGMRGIAMAKVEHYNLQLFMPTVNEWRSAIYGRGTKPPPDRNTTAKRKTWWKNKAKEYCAQLKIDAPDADSAEAALITLWLRSKLQYERYAQGEACFSG